MYTYPLGTFYLISVGTEVKMGVSDEQQNKVVKFQAVDKEKNKAPSLVCDFNR